jgi:ABC-type multidrug transport system ATPase subunit
MGIAGNAASGKNNGVEVPRDAACLADSSRFTKARMMHTLSTAGRDSMIEADGLCKYYGSFIATEDITFSVPRGQIVAFLGPNGAGKSTTMKMLTGYLAPSAGIARIAGYNMSTDRLSGAARLGYLPENGPLYPDMTPRSLLEFFADARGLKGARRVERIEAVVDQCELGSVIGKAIGKLSKGYRQRVGMAQVLLHEPDVLILDEPTSGLDPNQIRGCATRSAASANRRRSCSPPTSCRKWRHWPTG